MLIIDSREPKEVIGYFSRDFDEIRVEQLPIGDYYIPETAVVERKSVMDAISSIMDGRFEHQMMQLAMFHDNAVPILFVHGSVFEVSEMARVVRLRSNPWELITGAISSAGARYGIDIIFTENKEYGFMVLSKYLKKLPKRAHVKYTRKRNLDTRVMVLTAILHTSPKIARALLDKYGSVQNVIMSNLDDIEQIKGIGRKKASELRAVLAPWRKAVKGE